MAGQLTAVGAQAQANTIGGIVPPYIGTSAPTWVPGLVWIDTSSTPVAKYWNTQEWVAGPQTLYLALLTGDPTQSGPGGGYAQNISDLIEDQTAGYARQVVDFAVPASDTATTYPAPVTNSNVITFGPYTANMQTADGWAALVTAEAGDLGLLLYLWALPAATQVPLSKSIQIGVGSLSLTQS